MQHRTEPIPVPLPHIITIGTVTFCSFATASGATQTKCEAGSYFLMWFTHGPEHLELELGDRCMPWPRGGLVLICEGDRYRITNPSTRDAFGFQIGFNALPLREGRRPPEWPVMRTDLGPQSVLPSLLRYCHTEANAPEPSRTRLLAGAVSLIIQMFVSGQHHQGGDTSITGDLPQSLAKAITTILATEEDLGQLSPGLLAQQSGVTISHLGHLAKEHLGITLQQFILLRRLKAATRLLDETSLAFKEIAYRCGFASQAYFTRQFVREIGCTPSAYRRTPAGRRPGIELPLETAPARRDQLRSHGSTDLYECCRNAADPESLLLALEKAVRQEQMPYPRLAHMQHLWKPLSLEALVNRSRRPGPAAWIGSGYHLGELASGPQVIHGITFHVLEEATPEARSVLLLRSAKVRAANLPLQAELPIGRRLQALAILHACGWSQPKEHIGEYELVFEDGQVEQVPLWTSAEPPDLTTTPLPLLQDWWPTFHQFEHAAARKVTVFDPVNPLGAVRYLYSFLWRNPRPKVPVRSWRVRTTGQQQATLAVLALSVLPAAP